MNNNQILIITKAFDGALVLPEKEGRALVGVARESETYRVRVGEALVEPGGAAEHLLAVGVQLHQLVLDVRRVRRAAALDQRLAEHDERVDAVGVQGDLLLEAL